MRAMKAMKKYLSFGIDTNPLAPESLTRKGPEWGIKKQFS